MTKRAVKRSPKKYSTQEKENILHGLAVARSGPRGSVKDFLREAGVSQSMAIRWTAEMKARNDAAKAIAMPQESLSERIMRSNLRELRELGDVPVELTPKIMKPIVPINTDSNALVKMIADRDSLCSQRNDLQIKINALNQEIGSLIGTG